jgi:DNA-nicking Smr family endonuclease
MKGDEFKKKLDATLGGVERLKGDRRVLLRRDKAIRRSVAADSTPLTSHDTDLHAWSNPDLPTVTASDLLSFKQPGQQNNVFRKLAQARYTASNTLDLHGLTIEQSFNELHAMIATLQHTGTKNILVIHGKGLHHPTDALPILKNVLNHRLRADTQILAFCSAKTHHGGSGALYILLKNKEVT